MLAKIKLDSQGNIIEDGTDHESNEEEEEAILAELGIVADKQEK